MGMNINFAPFSSKSISLSKIKKIAMINSTRILNNGFFIIFLFFANIDYLKRQAIRKSGLFQAL